MNYFRGLTVSALLYTIIIILTRYAEIEKTALDWLALGSCSLIPLGDPIVRGKKYWNIALLLMVNFSLLFILTFWVIEIFFGEGL